MIIREGEKRDIPDVLKLILELAKYEKELDEVIMTEDQLMEDGFGDNPAFQLMVVEMDKECVGMALYYPQYSTWKGRSLFLEDLIVTESKRGMGIGKMLLDKLVELSKTSGMARLEWQVLDWNQPAIDFYKKYEAEFDDEWLNVRINFNKKLQ